MKPYSITKEELIKELNTSEEGLSKEEAINRLEKNGKNELDQAKKKSMIVKFLSQFKDIMIIVLLVAAVVSAAIAIYQKEYGELIDAGIILAIVLLNAIIGLVQENKAESALESLKNMNKSFSKVIRDKELLHIKSEEIVVGDLVVLEAGDIVPADIRLITSASLKIEEAALTGESVPSEKNALDVIDEKAALADRSNMAYSGGVVSYGRGSGIVVSVGMNTEVGKIAKMLQQSDNSVTPLQKQLAKTAKYLSIIVLGIAVIIFIFALINKDPFVDAFMTSVAIAVAAIPEGLPAVVTIVLAIGVQRMSKRNAIIRNLPAVETLGCCEIICSDKTGTLTLNQMTVKQLYNYTSKTVLSENYTSDYELVVRIMMLCNDTIQNGDELSGDPTETALVKYGEEKGVDYALLRESWKRVDEIPFDSVRKVMSTVNENGKEKMAFVKGALDLLLDKCAYIYDKEIRRITTSDIEEIKKANKDMTQYALRVLGLAIKKNNFEVDNLEQELVFVGLVGMIDPPRKEVKDAVRVCKEAGMKPVMITGDHIDTASVIAREIGIMGENDKAMLGADIDKYSDEDFRNIITEYAVFARVSPENKVRIVEAYQSLNKVVAMTGDGVNDAPSIKKANIGIGMGITGTDVSKGVADMVLTDDNFATIINSVEEGRKIYANIAKANKFLLSANFAEVLCLFIATIFLKVHFLTAVMILWVNLITDSFPALSLGVEEAEKDVMKHKPRKSKGSLFAGKMGIDILIQGVMQTLLVLGSFIIGNYVFKDNKIGTTMAFVSLCMVQLFHSYNIKYESGSVISKKTFNNKFLNLSFLLGTVLVLLVVLIPPIRNIFSATSLSFVQWVISIGFAIAIIPLVEIQKLIEKK